MLKYKKSFNQQTLTSDVNNFFFKKSKRAGLKSESSSFRWTKNIHIDTKKKTQQEKILMMRKSTMKDNQLTFVPIVLKVYLNEKRFA